MNKLVLLLLVTIAAPASLASVPAATGASQPVQAVVTGHKPCFDCW